MGYRRTLIVALSAFLIATAWPQSQAEEGPRIITFDAPGAGTGATQGTLPQQNLNSGTIVGYYVDANNVLHGFLRSAHGKFTTFDAPGAAGTFAFGINDDGTAVGYSFNANGVFHGYVRDDDGNFTTFDVPGAGTAKGQGTLAFAINRRGTVSGIYFDGNGVLHGFVRSHHGSITSFDPVGSVNTIGDTLGINRAGAISGAYFDASGCFTATCATPKAQLPASMRRVQGRLPATGLLPR